MHIDLFLQEFAPKHSQEQAGPYAYNQRFPRLLAFLGFRVSLLCLPPALPPPPLLPSTRNPLHVTFVACFSRPAAQYGMKGSHVQVCNRKRIPAASNQLAGVK